MPVCELIRRGRGWDLEPKAKKGREPKDWVPTKDLTGWQPVVLRAACPSSARLKRKAEQMKPEHVKESRWETAFLKKSWNTGRQGPGCRGLRLNVGIM